MDQQPQVPQVPQEQFLTPLPRKQGQSITLSFPDAMHKVIEGKRVSRISWANTDYCLLKDGWLSIFTKGGFHTFLVSDGDMIDAQDWFVMPEQN